MKSIASFKFYFVLLLFLDLQKLFSQQVTQFTTDNGLKSNNVYCIFQDHAQNIWFGTEEGLTRFNDWHSYTNNNSKILPNRVNTIFQDRAGNLWVGTTGGLSILLAYTESWQNLTRAQYPFITDHITSIFYDNFSNLWIGTRSQSPNNRGGGILRYRGGFGVRIDTSKTYWQMYDTGTTGDSGIISDDITALNSDHWGNLWVGTENYGLCKFDGEKKWTKIQNFSDNKIHIIFRDQTDTLWIGTSKGVFKTYDGTVWEQIENIPETFAIESDPLGNLWFGSHGQGLFRYEDGQVEKVTIGRLDGTQSCQTIFRDNDGNLWFAMNGDGVYRLQLNWLGFNTNNSNLHANFLTAAAVDRNGVLWFGTNWNHLAKYEKGVFSQVVLGSGRLGMEHINALLVDQSNYLWCATNIGVHCYINRQTWNSYLLNDTVQTIIQDYQGNFWFGTQKGLFLLEGNEQVRPIAKDSLLSNNISCLLEDADKNIWVGSDSGVVVLKNKIVIASYRVTDGLVSNMVNTIIQDRNHEFWVGTINGLSHLNQQKKWQTYQSESSDLVNNNVRCLLVDKNDQLWIGGAGGIDRFDGFFWWNYNSFISIGTGQENINAMVQDKKGNFWFATNKGAIYYTPSDRQPPETRFIGTPPKILGVGSHTFFYEGYDSDSPSEKLVYACCLIFEYQPGMHRNWQSFSTQKYFNCDFLQNGTYTLFIKTRDPAGNEEPIPREHTFKVNTTPPATIILEPVKDDFVTGEVPIIGATFDDSLYNDFKRYWFEYGRGVDIQDIKHWEILAGSDTTVFRNTLVIWKPDSLGDYIIKLCAEDTLGHTSNYAVHVKVVEIIKRISPTIGGLIQLLNQKLQLYIPPGAVAESVEIYGSPMDTSKLLRPLPGGIGLSPFAFELGDSSINFQKPATLTIHYNDHDISKLNESKLAIFAEAEKKVIGGLIKPQLNRIQTTIQKLGRFALVECEEPDQKDSSGTKSVVVQIECQPRIFSPRGAGVAATTTISFNLPEEATATIKIYNLAGRLVQTLLDHERLRAGENALEWNGRDSHGELCPSDLYIVTFQSPQDHITKTVMILDKSDH
jgi:ligand-binding sensor domain-containing protein